MGHQLRQADFHPVWAPACQGHVSGGYDGVGVVSLCGSTLSAPSLLTTEFREFFWLGRTGEGGVVHLSVVYGSRVLRRMLINLRLLMGCCRLCWLRSRWSAWGSRCSLRVI